MLDVYVFSYNNRTYRIDDIDWNQSPNSKFMKSDKTEISFADYYKQVSLLSFSVIAKLTSNVSQIGVKGQGHGGIKYAGNSTCWAC